MQPIRTKCKYGYIVFAITLLIAIDYVYRYFAFEPYNQSPLNIETPEGNAQPYHPSVVYIPGGWNGYAYWMAETPYPLGPDGDWNGLPPYRARWENPCIHASHDGIHWETPGDLVNPIDDLNETEIENRDFFSDTHLVMNGDTLECWYRICRTQRDETYILRKYSADGIHWSERETVIDLQDPAVVREGPGGMIVSPAIQKIGGRYCMWYVNDIGESRSICRSFSDDGRNWQKKEYCRLSDTAVVPWHIDVQRIDSIYYMVIYDFRNLTLWSSRDGLFFEKRRLLLAPSPKLGSFYAGGLYRSALLRDDKECKLYFSAFDKKTAVGLMRGNCPDSLKIYSVSGNKVSFFRFPVTYLRQKKQAIVRLFE